MSALATTKVTVANGAHEMELGVFSQGVLITFKRGRLSAIDVASSEVVAELVAGQWIPSSRFISRPEDLTGFRKLFAQAVKEN